MSVWAFVRAGVGSGTCGRPRRRPADQRNRTWRPIVAEPSLALPSPLALRLVAGVAGPRPGSVLAADLRAELVRWRRLTAGIDTAS